MPSMPPGWVPPRQVADVMTRAVVVTRPEVRLIEVASVLRELHVAGLPVLDARDRLIGVVSERDLVRDLGRATGAPSPRGLLDILLGSRPPVGGRSLRDACRDRLRQGRVRDVMSTRLVTIPPSATLPEAADQMRSEGVNRLPVVGPSGRLIGIVARSDLVRAVDRPGPSRRPGRRPSARVAPRGRHALDPFVEI